MEKPIDVVGVGNAIVDVLANVPDDFLEAHGMAKGSMILIDEARAQTLYGRMGPAIECSGGSAANTMVGLASLGGSAGYIGRVRDDQLGEVFRHDIRAAGVRFDTPAAADGPATARCLIFVSPDAQRTMNTFLGASTGLGLAEIDAGLISQARITYLEGYLWDQPPAKEAFLAAAAACHAAGGRVALTLSDSFCVDRHRESFLELISGHVDVLFANEAEIVSLFECTSFDEAVRALGGRCEIAALTRGPDGSTVVHGDEIFHVRAEPIEKLVDTTGAGDLYAAGFLFGLTRQRPLADCARLGGLAAAEIIQHVGARPRLPLRERVPAEYLEA